MGREAAPRRSCGPDRSLVSRQRLQKVRHLRNGVDTHAAMSIGTYTFLAPLKPCSRCRRMRLRWAAKRPQGGPAARIAASYLGSGYRKSGTCAMV